jgi:hypothetical protein
MSAGDHLNGAQFFHVSDREFKPGEELRPAAQTGTQSAWSHLPTYSPDHVYVYRGNKTKPQPWDVKDKFGPALGQHVYRVEPKGPLADDPEHTSKRAKIVPSAVVVDKVHSYEESAAARRERLLAEARATRVPRGLRGPNFKP